MDDREMVKLLADNLRDLMQAADAFEVVLYAQAGRDDLKKAWGDVGYAVDTAEKVVGLANAFLKRQDHR